MLLVEDTDIKRLEPGQKSHLRIDELPGQVIDGEVVEISKHKLDDGDRTKTGRQDLSPLLAGMIAPGHNAPLYEARVRFRRESRVKSQESDKRQETRVESQKQNIMDQGLALDSRLSTLDSLLIGARGEAKVFAERITIGQRIAATWPKHFASRCRLGSSPTWQFCAAIWRAVFCKTVYSPGSALFCNCACPLADSQPLNG